MLLRIYRECWEREEVLIPRFFAYYLKTVLELLCALCNDRSMQRSSPLLVNGDWRKTSLSLKATHCWADLFFELGHLILLAGWVKKRRKISLFKDYIVIGHQRPSKTGLWIEWSDETVLCKAFFSLTASLKVTCITLQPVSPENNPLFQLYIRFTEDGEKLVKSAHLPIFLRQPPYEMLRVWKASEIHHH